MDESFWTSKDVGLMVIAGIYVALAPVVPATVWFKVRARKGWQLASLSAIGVSLLVSFSALPIVLASLSM